MLRKRLLINSKLDRDINGSNSDFIVYMDESLNPGSNHFMIGLKKVSLPNTVYTFHFKDSYLWYLYDGTLYNIKIPTNEVIEDGTQLASTLKDLFGVNGHSIDVNFNDTTNRLQFTNNSSVDIRIVSSNLYETTVNGQDIVNSCNDKVGLIEDLTNNVITPSVTYEAKGVPKIISSSVFHITSKTLGNYKQSILPKQQSNQQFILYTLLNTAGFGNIIQKDIERDDVKWMEVDETLDKIDIQLRDEDYRIIDLNGANVILELEMWESG